MRRIFAEEIRGTVLFGNSPWVSFSTIAVSTKEPLTSASGLILVWARRYKRRGNIRSGASAVLVLRRQTAPKTVSSVISVGGGRSSGNSSTNSLKCFVCIEFLISFQITTYLICKHWFFVLLSVVHLSATYFRYYTIKKISTIELLFGPMIKTVHTGVWRFSPSPALRPNIF